MRIFLPIGVCLSLTACTSVFSDVKSTWDYATQQREDANLTLSEIEAFPYTAIYARWAEGRRALVVLGYADGDDLSWVTADRETLISRHGRVIRTSGLQHELQAHTNLAEDPLRCIQANLPQIQPCNLQWSSVIDVVTAERRFSVVRESQFSLGDIETLELPAGVTRVYPMIETVRYVDSQAGGASVMQNIFYLEPDGHVVKSVQHLTPNAAPLEITQLKWVGR